MILHRFSEVYVAGVEDYVEYIRVHCNMDEPQSDIIHSKVLDHKKYVSIISRDSGKILLFRNCIKENVGYAILRYERTVLCGTVVYIDDFKYSKEYMSSNSIKSIMKAVEILSPKQSQRIRIIVKNLSDEFAQLLVGCGFVIIKVLSKSTMFERKLDNVFCREDRTRGLRYF